MAVRAYTPQEYEAIAQQLAGVYREGERQILKLLSGDGLTDWKEAFLRERLQQIQAIVAGLDAETADWAGVHIPAVYQHNLDVGAARAGLDPGMTALHQQQVAIIQNSVTRSLNYANGGIGRAVEDVYRKAALQSLQQGMIGGETRREVSKQFLADLQSKGVTSFVDKSGRSWDMTQYAEMVARTNTMEASKTATYNQVLEAGGDLVEVSSHGDPCELCEPYDGELLSISGDNVGMVVGGREVIASVGEAEAAGLFHPACLHDLYPV